MDNGSVNYFAQTDFRGKKTPFGIKPLDRARHVYVIGKTGMGKSTMLENLAIQDIKNGEGICFMDPHGKTAELLLEYVPQERINDVIYFAPFDLEYPIAFNVMEDVGRDQRHLVANGLMSAFKKIWEDAWSARMEYILNNTLLALMEYPKATLLGVNRMLSDKDYRKRVVDNISDPSVKSFWVDEFAKYNERYMQEAGDAIKNKIGQFTSNPLIRNIIGQSRSTLNFRQMMDERKILIINLSKGRLGEDNAKLIGAMLITKIYLAAMSRANVTETDLRRLPFFYLFVDEFQTFVNDSFADILSEARKYKLSLTIAHQYVDQMPENVRAAVFGNVGTTVAFRVGPLDAELLEKIFFPTFTQQDMVNLGFAQIYLTLMIDGIGSQPFSAVTLPPIQSLGTSYIKEIIAHTRETYGSPRAEVEAEIIKWHQDGHPEKKPEPAVAPPRARDERRVSPAPIPLERRQAPYPYPKAPPPAPPPRPSPTPANRSNGPQPSVSLSQLKQETKDTGRHREALREALAGLAGQKEPPKPNSQPPAPPSAKNEVPEETLRKMLEVDIPKQ